MASGLAKKTRRPRFTDKETLTLVQEVKSRAAVILGKLKGNVTIDRKNKAWEAVTASVNTIARVKRTPNELRRKFRDLRSHVKMKAVAEKHAASTEERPPADVTYSDAELIVLRMLPHEALTGLLFPKKVSGSVLNPQPSTSTVDGVLQSSSAEPIEATVFYDAMGESSSVLTVDVDEDLNFKIVQHTNGIPQGSQDPTGQLFSVDDLIQSSAVLQPSTDPQSSTASPSPGTLQPPTALQASQPSAALQSHKKTAGSQSKLKLIPQVLENQQEIQDLLYELVQVQHEQAQAQRELVEFQQQSSETQREFLIYLGNLQLMPLSGLRQIQNKIVQIKMFKQYVAF